MPQFDLRLRGGTVVAANGREQTDIRVSSARITALGELGQSSAPGVVSCPNQHVLPSVIETQVHLDTVGFDANLTIVDLAAERHIEDRWIRGRLAMRNDELLGKPMGQSVSFTVTLTPQH
jgi:predicted amidohydrolase